MQADSLPAEPQGKPNSPITSWQIDGGKVEIVDDREAVRSAQHGVAKSW